MSGPVGVIGLRVPHPIWMYSSPAEGGIPFGKHYADGCREHDRVSFQAECGGELYVFSAGENEIHSRDHDPIEVRCARCDFSFLLHPENKRQAILEWMRIAFGYVIFTLRFHPVLRDDRGRREMAAFEIVRFPTNNPLEWDLDQELGTLLAPIVNKEYWVETIPRYIVPGWGDHQIVVAHIFDEDFLETKDLLLADAAFLLQNMEQSFQKAIKRAAQMASSASEPFHPRTRRPLGDL